MYYRLLAEQTTAFSRLGFYPEAGRCSTCILAGAARRNPARVTSPPIRRHGAYVRGKRGGGQAPRTLCCNYGMTIQTSDARTAFSGAVIGVGGGVNDALLRQQQEKNISLQ